jgi:hypothetical protein
MARSMTQSVLLGPDQTGEPSVPGEPSEQACRHGTFNGKAAEASKYTFAPCILPKGHTGDCDAGDELPDEDG